jgi:hypothetical protein
MSMQSKWKWCNKCQGLSWTGNPTMGPCPGGAHHDHEGSGEYSLTVNI